MAELPASTPGAVGRRLFAEVSASTVLGALPSFLFAAGYISERQSLGSNGGLALALTVSGTALAGIVGGVLGGNLVGRRAGSKALRVAVCTIGGALIAAGASRNWAELGLLIATTGVFSGLARAIGTAVLATAAGGRSLPTYMSVRQAFVPVSLIVAGLGAAASADLVGWRWTYVGIGCVTFAAGLCIRTGLRTMPAREKGAPQSRLPLAVLATAALGLALGLLAEEVLSTYWVVSAVHDGVSVAKAGVLISLGGLLAATARVFSGLGASRLGSREFTISGASLVLGSTGLSFMAVGKPATALVALIVGFGIGWSWNGVAAAGLVRLCRERLGLAASVEQVSRQAGNLVAPLFFIWLRDDYGQRPAWLCSALGCAAAGGLLILAGRTGRLRPVLAVQD